MKKVFVMALLTVSSYVTYAQNQANMDGSATQRIELLLSNAIDVSFTSNNSDQGPLVEIPFTTINDYVNGVESDPQEIRVRSTKKFKVDVKANASAFTYTGITSPAPVMPAGILELRVSANSTGGTFDGPYNATNYYPITDFNQLLLLNCNAGADQKFSVVYNANPGFAYPAGNYAISVVYTATQL